MNHKRSRGDALYALPRLLILALAAARACQGQVVAGKQHLRGQADTKESALLFLEGGSSSNISNKLTLVPGPEEHITAFKSRHAEATTNQGNATMGQAPKPRLFFLFLTRSGINRPDLWKSFFDSQSTTGEHHLSRVFVHCMHSHLCSQELALSNAIR